MIVLEKSISIYELLGPTILDGVTFAEDEEILLAAISSFLYYECRSDDCCLRSVASVLNCISYRHGCRDNSVFDCLFKPVKERTAIHPAVVLYDVFSKFPVARKIAIRDSCLSKLGLSLKDLN